MSAQDLAIAVLGSGSKGNSVIVHDRNDALLVDAGFSMRQLLLRMQEINFDPSMLRAILVTHEHQDHIKGLCAFANAYNLPILATNGTATEIYLKNDKLRNVKTFSSGQKFQFAGFKIQPFSIPHDAADPVGMVICKNDKKVGIATDLGRATEVVLERLRHCHSLFVESNHDFEMLYNSLRPMSIKQRIAGSCGHLNNKDCMKLLENVIQDYTQNIILGHISQDCNQYDLVEKHLKQNLTSISRLDIQTAIATQDQPITSMWC